MKKFLSVLFALCLGANLSFLRAEQPADEAPVLMMAEVMPEFPGGDKALYQYISDNLNYPAEAKAAGAQGRAMVGFIVEADGVPTHAEIQRSTGNEALDAEAIRLVETMPRFTPGKQQGKEVRVRYTLPVTFRL